MKKSLTSALLILLPMLAIHESGLAEETATPKVSSSETQHGGSARSYEDEFSGVRDFARIVKDLNCNSKDIKYSQESCQLIGWIKQKGTEYKLCKQFFSDEKGQLGPYGKEMAALIADDIARNEKESVFYQPNHDTDISCPGFKDMTPMQKAAFHTWVWELTALPESSCNAEIKDNSSSAVPTGKAVGMYQTEYLKKDREWRSVSPSKTNAIDPKTKKGKMYCAVPESEIRTLAGNTGCAFDDYKRHLIATGYMFGQWSDANPPKRLHPAQWAAHTRLNKKQTEEVIAYQACRAKNKCKSNLILNERSAAYTLMERLEKFPLCKTAAAAEELRDLSK